MKSIPNPHKTKDQIYMEANNHYKEGGLRGDNPYHYGTIEHEWWLKGFTGPRLRVMTFTEWLKWVEERKEKVTIEDFKEHLQEKFIQAIEDIDRKWEASFYDRLMNGTPNKPKVVFYNPLTDLRHDWAKDAWMKSKPNEPDLFDGLQFHKPYYYGIDAAREGKDSSAFFMSDINLIPQYIAPVATLHTAASERESHEPITFDSLNKTVKDFEDIINEFRIPKWARRLRSEFPDVDPRTIFIVLSRTTGKTKGIRWACQDYDAYIRNQIETINPLY